MADDEVAVEEVSSVRLAGDLMRHFAVVLAVIVVLTGIAMILMANRFTGMSLAYLVFLFGTVGGVANNYRRVTELIEADETVTLQVEKRRLVTAQIYLSPVIGGVFAIVLYGLFLGQSLITGDLFPSFGGCADATFDGFDSFANCSPDTNGEVAKAFVWAFAAGFLERLVPNFIAALTTNPG